MLGPGGCANVCDESFATYYLNLNCESGLFSASYRVATAGAKDCPTGTAAITSYSACQKAAEMYLKESPGIGPLGAAETWSGTPGCHVQFHSGGDGNFQFNTNLDGNGTPEHAPVCTVAGGGSTATTESPVLDICMVDSKCPTALSTSCSQFDPITTNERWSGDTTYVVNAITSSDNMCVRQIIDCACKKCGEHISSDWPAKQAACAAADGVAAPAEAAKTTWGGTVRYGYTDAACTTVGAPHGFQRDTRPPSSLGKASGKCDLSGSVDLCAEWAGMACSTKWDEHCPAGHPWGSGVTLAEGCPAGICTGPHVARKAVYKGKGKKCDAFVVTENSEANTPVTKTHYFFVGRLGLSSGGFCSSELRSQCETAMNALNVNPYVDPGKLPGMTCQGGFSDKCTQSNQEGPPQYLKITFQSDAQLVQRVKTLSAKEVLNKATADEGGSAKLEVTIDEASKVISQQISGGASSSAPVVIDPVVMAQFDSDNNGSLNMDELTALVQNIQDTQVGSASASIGSSTTGVETGSTSGGYSVSNGGAGLITGIVAGVFVIAMEV
jgi:hypothetical protein